MSVPGPPRLKTQPLVGINNLILNEGFIRVSWLPPFDDGGSPLTNYEYELRDLGGGLASSGGLPAEQTEITFNGFPDGYQFIFSIRASNAGYGGPYGPTVQTQPWQVGDPPTVGPATVSFAAESISTGTLSWTAPSSLPTADIRWYVGRISPYWDQLYNQQQLGRAAWNTPELYVSSIGVQQISIVGVQAVNCPGYSPQTNLTYFPGTGSALFVAASSSLMNLSPGILLGSSSFTFEVWINLNSTPTNMPLFDASSKGLPTFAIQLASDTELILTDGTTIVSYTIPTLSTGTWYYIALVRDATTNDETVWVNGTRSSTGVQTDATSYGTCNRVGWSGAASFDGYMTNIRIVLGSALYSPSSASISVPTTQFVPVAGTQFLLLECNADAVATDFANLQTISTDVTWDAANPF